MVEYLTHNPKFEGSNTLAAGTRREKIARKVNNLKTDLRCILTRECVSYLRYKKWLKTLILQGMVENLSNLTGS